MNLYQEQLMDHYKHPRHRGTLEHADFNTQIYNPSCGDGIAFYGRVQDNKVVELKFMGSGCVISQATASLLTEHSLGKSLEDIEKFDKDFILALIGMELGPMRIKCALLPLEAVQEGIKNYRSIK